MKKRIARAVLFSIYEGMFDECYSLETVYYEGTEAKWNSVYVERYNDCFWNATLIFLDKPDILNGDVDGDGVINGKDANTFSATISGAYVITPDSIEFENADLDGDGALTGKDMNLLKRIIAGMEEGEVN